MSQPQPKIPSELIKYLGKAFNAWHIALPLLESHSMLFPQVRACQTAPEFVLQSCGESEMPLGFCTLLCLAVCMPKSACSHFLGSVQAFLSFRVRLKALSQPMWQLDCSQLLACPQPSLQEGIIVPKGIQSQDSHPLGVLKYANTLQDSRYFNSLAELYSELNEEDVLSGLWKRRCCAPETRAAVGWMQHGYLDTAQDALLQAMSKHASKAYEGGEPCSGGVCVPSTACVLCIPAIACKVV